MIMHFITRLVADTSGLGAVHVPIVALIGVSVVDNLLVCIPATI